MKYEKVYNKKLKQWVWKIDGTIAGQRIRRAEFPTKQDAQDAVASLLLEARNERYGLSSAKPHITLDHLRAEREKRKEKQIVAKSVFVLQDWAGLIGRKKLLVDLRRADYTLLVEFYKKRGIKDATVNQYLIALSAALHDVPEYFGALEDWTPPKIPWLTAKSERKRTLARAELERIFLALRAEREKGEHRRLRFWKSEMLDVIRLMLLTGCRRGELRILVDSQLDMERQTARIIAPKTTTERTIPLSQSAIEILRPRMKGLTILAPYNENHHRNTMIKVSERAGLIYSDREEGGWVLHDLRHTAATVIEDAGFPYSVISELLGHRRQDQTATYTHAQAGTMRRAVEHLESWCRDIDGFSGELQRQQSTPETRSNRSGF